jgi:hypothetical protein
MRLVVAMDTTGALIDIPLPERISTQGVYLGNAGNKLFVGLESVILVYELAGG